MFSLIVKGVIEEKKQHWYLFGFGCVNVCVLKAFPCGPVGIESFDFVGSNTDSANA